MPTYPVNRILIIGGPGSGKTTLGNQLSRAIGARLVELDSVAYENGAGAQRSLDDVLRDVDIISSDQQWIAEGIYLWWTEQLMSNADIIIWLDIPWRKAQFRIIKRHIQMSLARVNKQPGIKRLLKFLSGSRSYYLSELPEPTSMDDHRAVSRIATERALSKYSEKVFQCRSEQELECLMDSITSKSESQIKN